MKKILLFILLILLVLSGCNKKNSEVINILTPEGIPAIALGGLFDDENYNFKTVAGSDLLSGELIKGEYDIVVAPIILGAQLYAKESLDKYQLQAIITLGNSYLVCKKENKIESLKELEGKKIAAYGKNTAPDIVLKEALKVGGVDLEKVDIVYENSVQDVLTNRFLTDDSIDYILSAEPIITRMKTKLANKVGEIEAIDLQEALKEKMEMIPQAGIFVNKDLDQNTLNKFKEDLGENVIELNENPSNYATSLVNLTSENKRIFESIGVDVIEASVPGSMIVYKDAYNNKDVLDKYFEMINDGNLNILNGAKINENFYRK